MRAHKWENAEICKSSIGSDKILLAFSRGKIAKSSLTVLSLTLKLMDAGPPFIALYYDLYYLYFVVVSESDHFKIILYQNCSFFFFL